MAGKSTTKSKPKARTPKKVARATSKQKNLPAPASKQGLVPLKGRTIKQSCSAAGHHVGRAKSSASVGAIKVGGSKNYNAQARRTSKPDGQPGGAAAGPLQTVANQGICGTVHPVSYTMEGG